MELHADRPEPSSGEALRAAKPSEDDLAREMIERIARQVDLESGVVPRPSESEPEAAGAAEEPGHELVLEGAERSEEDVARELVERIAREVGEGRGG